MNRKPCLPRYGDAFYYKNGSLTVDGITMDSIAKKVGSPFYVYSGKLIRDSYRSLTTSLKSVNLQVCYAVKANSNLEILKLLKSVGAGCDLVSYGEWHRAELAKIPREKRVLSGVAKTAVELEKLFRLPNGGVYSIHVESAMEFELIILMANAMRRNVQVAFRYNPDVDAKTIEQISTGRKKDKFGLTREEILDLVCTYGDDDFVSIKGLSIHIGSQIMSLKPYEAAFKKLKKLKAEVEDHLGRKLEYVDLGGGVGVQYKTENPIDLIAYGKLVKKYFADMDKVLIEPGRSLLANAGALVTEVVFSKVRPHNRTLILDAGMNDLMRPALYSAYHEILPVMQTRETPKSWDIVGGICETTDYFARDRKLAVEGLPGERVAIMSSGAYGYSMSNTYNTRPRVPEVLVDRGKVFLIHERESLTDLMRGETSVRIS